MFWNLVSLDVERFKLNYLLFISYIPGNVFGVDVKYVWNMNMLKQL